MLTHSLKWEKANSSNRTLSEFSVLYRAAGHATRVSPGPDTLVHFSCLTAVRQK